MPSLYVSCSMPFFFQQEIMKSQFVFLMLVLFSASVLSQDPNVSLRYRNFINRHIKGEMSVNRCDDVIRSRGITQGDGNECRKTNTFIQATTNLVKDICLGAGKPYGQMRISLQPFSVIVCKLRNQVRLPRCEYRGQARTRQIVIRCEQGFPVHFEEDVIPTDN